MATLSGWLVYPIDFYLINKKRGAKKKARLCDGARLPVCDGYLMRYITVLMFFATFVHATLDNCGLVLGNRQ